MSNKSEKVLYYLAFLGRSALLLANPKFPSFPSSVPEVQKRPDFISVTLAEKLVVS